jgi:hypothetical protein
LIYDRADGALTPSLMRGQRTARASGNQAAIFFASFGALAACSDTILHAVEFFAARGACLANFGALAAYMLMVVRLAGREIDRDGAYLRAIHHGLDKLGCSVLVTNPQAMVHRHM